MNFLLNLLWLFLGGAAAAMTWFIVGLVMLISIIGIPWASACFNIAVLTFWPFGSRLTQTTQGKTMKRKSLLGKIIWILIAGWWLALVHLIYGILFCITIIGIPFGIQHFKLARLSLSPVGKSILLDI